MSTRKSPRSTARAVTSPINRDAGPGEHVPRRPVPEQKEEVPERRGRREGADVGRADTISLPPHRPSPRAVPVGDDAHHLPAFRAIAPGRVIPPLLGAWEEEPLPPDPRGKERLEESLGGVLSRGPVHRQGLAASSFVVPGPTLATRRVPARSRPRAGRTLAEKPDGIRAREEDPVEGGEAPDLPVEGAAILGVRQPDRGEEDRNAARAPDQAASSPACSALRVTRIRFPRASSLHEPDCRYTSSRISLPPRDRSSPASATPTASGSETGPLRIPRRIREPSGFRSARRGQPCPRSPFRAPRWDLAPAFQPLQETALRPDRQGRLPVVQNATASRVFSVIAPDLDPSAPCPIAGMEMSAGIY